MILRPNVKINLGLNILRKRPDGYHDLETLFVPVLSGDNQPRDTLEVVTGEAWSETAGHILEEYGPSQRVQAITPDGKLMITIARKEGVDWNPLKDLAARAYGLLAAEHDLPPMKIFLEKGSPVGAGLGGGSADAAFALRAVSELAGLGLTDAQLAGYAARLGSDCAFFIYNTPMFASGRGEVLEPFSFDEGGPMMPFRIELVIPEGVSVSTAEAYSAITPHVPETPLKEILRRPDSWRKELKNDFEPSVFARHPELARLKEQLYGRGAFYAAMSGSGSALFGLFR